MPKKGTKNRINHGGRPVEVGRFFRGLPVVEATEPLRIVVNKSDIKSGKRLDPNNCVFAQACKRLFNSHAVLFLRRTAYVELPDSKGIRQVHRFMISKETADKIHHFDKTGEADEGGFILNPPPISRTIEAHKTYTKRYNREIATGKRTPQRGVRRKSRFIKTMEGVRDGRGKLGINYAY